MATSVKRLASDWWQSEANRVLEAFILGEYYTSPNLVASLVLALAFSPEARMTPDHAAFVWDMKTKYGAASYDGKPWFESLESADPCPKPCFCPVPLDTQDGRAVSVTEGLPGRWKMGGDLVLIAAPWNMPVVDSLTEDGLPPARTTAEAGTYCQDAIEVDVWQGSSVCTMMTPFVLPVSLAGRDVLVSTPGCVPLVAYHTHVPTDRAGSVGNIATSRCVLAWPDDVQLSRRPHVFSSDDEDKVAITFGHEPLRNPDGDSTAFSFRPQSRL